MADIFESFGEHLESINEIKAQKLTPDAKKHVKGMQKVKVSGLNGHLPDSNYVYYEKAKNQWWFIDFEGDTMELNNLGTLEQLQKIIQANNIEIN